MSALATFVLLLAITLPAAAHEQRQVGKYTLEVGWREEPALEGTMNAVQVEVHETATGKGVAGLTRTVRILVSFGGSVRTFEPTLVPVFEEPGKYVGAIIPTRTGDYIFRVSGKIEEQSVDERFESGPGRFDTVGSPTSLQFPDQPGGDPALARDQRATRELAEQARLAASAGLGIAVVALGVALVGLRRRRAADAPVRGTADR